MCRASGEVISSSVWGHNWSVAVVSSPRYGYGAARKNAAPSPPAVVPAAQQAGQVNDGPDDDADNDHTHRDARDDHLLLFYADPPVDKRFVEQIFVNNHALINQTGSLNTVDVSQYDRAGTSSITR